MSTDLALFETRYRFECDDQLTGAYSYRFPDAPGIVRCALSVICPVIIVQTTLDAVASPKGTHTLNCTEIGIRTYKAWNLAVESAQPVADFI